MLEVGVDLTDRSRHLSLMERIFVWLERRKGLIMGNWEEIRQKISPECIVCRLDNTLRKCLGYLTPNEKML